MKKTCNLVLVLLTVVFCLFSLVSCVYGDPITYTYDELKTDLIKIEVVNRTVSYNDGYQEHMEVCKTLNAEESEYVLTKIESMEFLEITTMEKHSLKGHIIVLYYPSYELLFAPGAIRKNVDSNELGEQLFFNIKHNEELDELINYLLDL